MIELSNIDNKKKIRILFIHPNPRPEWTKDKSFIWFPMGLAYVVDAVRRAGYDFHILDFQVNPMSDEELKVFLTKESFDVVGIGALSNSYYIVKPILELVREMLPNALILGGNSVAASKPELFITKTEADVAVVGEGEKTVVELLDRLASGRDLCGVNGIVHFVNGKIINEEKRPPWKNLDDRPFPDWGMFDINAYVESGSKHKNVRLFTYLREHKPFLINTSLGCPFRCTFCYNSLYYENNPLRFHSAEVLVKEIKYLRDKYGINFFIFLDELTWTTPRIAEPLVDVLIEADLNIKYEASVRVGFLNKGDEDFAKKLKKSGCHHLSYSLESGSEKILKIMNKKIKISRFKEQKRILDEVGIISSTSLVLGYPEETVATLKETFDVCYECNIYPSVGFLVPLPGSIIYEQAIKNGWITNEEEYFLGIKDRQFLDINMSEISNKEIMDTVFEGLKKIRDKLKLNITDKQLIFQTIIKKENDLTNEEVGILKDATSADAIESKSGSFLTTG
ncbi:MAG: B12-binding domain-containing radical SAM protein [gamma proteobacterium symbiont of Taylorina sp.]|nr:B12-binding domain-containing radical SAM protein [gamma proteobacterium symbiont of Taylorina sp.]